LGEVILGNVVELSWLFGFMLYFSEIRVDAFLVTAKFAKFS
jgi:hypothetical protein